MRSSSRVTITTGHRRLGRDAIHRAVPVAVQHRVADHQHACLGRVAAWMGSCHGRLRGWVIAPPRAAPGSCPRPGSRDIARSAAWPRSRTRHSGSGSAAWRRGPARACTCGWNCSCSSVSPASHFVAATSEGSRFRCLTYHSRAAAGSAPAPRWHRAHRARATARNWPAESSSRAPAAPAAMAASVSGRATSGSGGRRCSATWHKVWNAAAASSGAPLQRGQLQPWAGRIRSRLLGLAQQPFAPRAGAAEAACSQR